MTLSEIIEKHSLNKAHMASQIGMPYSTFKNKISEKQTLYKFTNEEELKLRIVLRDMAHEILSELKRT